MTTQTTSTRLLIDVNKSYLDVVVEVLNVYKHDLDVDGDVLGVNKHPLNVAGSFAK